jgi:catechol 2,3-dioxygenase-like lactoylglutathione lyase family enzyme
MQFMHFNHLGLPVRDEGRSQQFYSTYFGFDPATAQEYADGTVIIRNADGFDLALHRLRTSSRRPRSCMPASKPHGQLRCAR